MLANQETQEVKKLFAGWRDQLGCSRVHIVRGKTSTPLPPRRDVWDLCPDDFDWGFVGPAPCQLSLALLCHVTGSEAIALKWYADFAVEVISRLPPGSWQLDEVNVLAWIWSKVEDLLPPLHIRLGREAFYDA